MSGNKHDMLRDATDVRLVAGGRHSLIAYLSIRSSTGKDR